MITIEAVLVLVVFLLPGYIGLKTFEWLVAARARSMMDLTIWSAGLSILAAAPLVGIPWTRPLLWHLSRPEEIGIDAAIGVALQIVVAVLLAILAAAAVTKGLRGRVGRKSFYPVGWDWLWGNFGNDDRYVTVHTDREIYHGTLAFADEAPAGRDLGLRDPAQWNEGAEDFYRAGMKYLLIPGQRVHSVELSVANPPVKEDEPYLGSGFINSSDTEFNKEGDSDV